MKITNIHKKIYITIFLLCIILVSVFSGFVPVEHLNDDNNERVKYINHVITNTIKEIFNESFEDNIFNPELFNEKIVRLGHENVSNYPKDIISDDGTIIKTPKYTHNSRYDNDFDNIKNLIINQINSIHFTEDINNKVQKYLGI